VSPCGHCSLTFGKPFARWGVIDGDAAQSEVEAKLGIKVAKVEIESEDIPGGVLDFTLKHLTNVIVMATRGRQGPNRLLYGSKLRRSLAALKCCQQFLSGLRRGVSCDIVTAMAIPTATDIAALTITAATILAIGTRVITPIVGPTTGTDRPMNSRRRNGRA
jgi:hypothetical protein